MKYMSVLIFVSRDNSLCITLRALCVSASSAFFTVQLNALTIEFVECAQSD